MAFQIGSTLLDACVLAVLEREDTYGYRLTQQIRAVVEVSESTLYPVLRRLQKDGLLTTYDAPCNGRNRRYYRATGAGCTQLAQYRAEWAAYTDKINQFLKGEQP